jgi:hypothetical protein
MDTPTAAPGWRVVGVSVTGPDHVRAGVENQDAFAHRSTVDGFVLAVADGAGSAARSGLGARLAVACAGDAARVALDGPPPARSAWPALARGYAGTVLRLFDRRLAALTAGEPADRRAAYATTVLAVVARPPRYLYLSVGDCFLVAEHRDGGAHLITTTTPGASLATTLFLTSADRDAGVRAGLVDDARITGLALCSDGLLEGMLAADQAPDGSPRLRAPADFTGYLRAFAGAGACPADLHRRLESDTFAATSPDDKTMLLAVRS